MILTCNNTTIKCTKSKSKCSKNKKIKLSEKTLCKDVPAKNIDDFSFLNSFICSTKKEAPCNEPKNNCDDEKKDCTNHKKDEKKACHDHKQDKEKDCNNHKKHCTDKKEHCTPTCPETVIEKMPIYEYRFPITSQSISSSTPFILLRFTTGIIIPSNERVTLLFKIKRYSRNGSGADIGSTYVFSDYSENTACKSFSFQYLDSGITEEQFTYSIEASCLSNKIINPSMLISNASLNLITGE